MSNTSPETGPKQVRRASISPGSAGGWSVFWCPMMLRLKSAFFGGGAKKCHLFLRPENRSVMKGSGSGVSIVEVVLVAKK